MAKNDQIPAGDVTKSVKALMIMSFATVISISAALVAIYTSVQSKVIAVAVDHKGVVVPIIPLTSPLLSESRVLGFAEECIRMAFSHDFLHFDKTIPLAQECFTPNSADKFVQSLQPYIKVMEEKRMVMSVTVPRPPRVVLVYTKTTPLGDVVHWDVQAQIEVFFEGRNERIAPTRNTVQLTVKRVPLEATPRGVLIDKLSVGPVI